MNLLHSSLPPLLPIPFPPPSQQDTNNEDDDEESSLSEEADLSDYVSGSLSVGRHGRGGSGRFLRSSQTSSNVPAAGGYHLQRPPSAHTSHLPRPPGHQVARSQSASRLTMVRQVHFSYPQTPPYSSLLYSQPRRFHVTSSPSFSPSLKALLTPWPTTDTTATAAITVAVSRSSLRLR